VGSYDQFRVLEIVMRTRIVPVDWGTCKKHAAKQKTDFDPRDG
jgi:hypothetical protein